MGKIWLIWGKIGINWSKVKLSRDEVEDRMGWIWVTYQSRQILFQFQSVWLQLLLDFVELIGPWAVEREQTEQTRSLKVISVHFATLIPTKMSPQKSPGLPPLFLYLFSFMNIVIFIRRIIFMAIPRDGSYNTRMMNFTLLKNILRVHFLGITRRTSYPSSKHGIIPLRALWSQIYFSNIWW